MVLMSMSGGSLYAAICSETFGGYVGSGSRTSRSHRARQMTSQLSKTNVIDRKSATSSSKNRIADARAPNRESPANSVYQAANERDASDDATSAGKTHCPSGFR